MNAGSAFTGIGGFDLGLERAGLAAAWQIENDKACRQVLEQHWPEVAPYGDVKEIDGRRLATVDVLCGGFPCQDVSVAGRRAGLAGERSGLFYEFMRLARELAPRWLLIENVPGLLSSNKGEDMGAVLGEMATLGYGYAWRVLDAQYFGVAQRRARVFIVGCLGDAARAAQVLFEPESCSGDSPPERQAGEVTAAITAGRTGDHGFPGADDNDARGGRLVARTLTGHHGRDDGDTQTFVTYRKATKVHGATEDDERWQEDGLSPTLDAAGHGPRTATAVVSIYPETGQGSRLAARVTDLSPPLTETDGKIHDRGARVVSETSVRRLTPRECERLQGFPDDWTAQLSDSARYRTLGNAVCVPVAEWIGRRIVSLNDEGE